MFAEEAPEPWAEVTVQASLLRPHNAQNAATPVAEVPASSTDRLRAFQIGMAEIGGKDRQQPLHIRALAVPGGQDVDRGAVPKVMQARDPSPAAAPWTGHRRSVSNAA